MAPPESQNTLSALFDEGFNQYKSILNADEPTSSNSYQEKLKRCITLLEDATRFVSAMDIFSSNEDIKEISSDNLKFMLLPAMLGHLTLRETTEPSGRLDLLKTAEAYFKDYLLRCRDYGLIEKVDFLENEPEEDDSKKVPSTKPSFNSLMKQREEKVKRYKEEKTMEDELKDLEIRIKDGRADEDTVRQFHMTQLRKFVNASYDELDSIAREKPMLQHMVLMKASGKDTKGPFVEKPHPLKPVIICRDEMQKKVFGLGYPSLPTVTVEEYYKQRMGEGWLQEPAAQGAVNVTREEVQRREEEEEIKKEREVEEDDEEMLRRQRGWDEWKEDNPKGMGNRYNRS
ncbi:unnamed protein product [Darwinula stevensoni]|uniref:TAP42-like protein n=1 Tax=Darwinula stevensoni TaxID=69355 RepID=A0A7R8XMF8_9CRUS|nr:unnamed protein product [Darwinula stevensoni]CAG0895566.1 unnamed protein product [Darwinula stevensoni]